MHAAVDFDRQQQAPGLAIADGEIEMGFPIEEFLQLLDADLRTSSFRQRLPPLAQDKGTLMPTSRPRSSRRAERRAFSTAISGDDALENDSLRSSGTLSNTERMRERWNPKA